MLLPLHDILKTNEKVAVAVSGGCDSMSLLHFLFENSAKLGIRVLAINVEHGIRGQASIEDSLFVKDYCDKKGIKLLSYSVNALEYARENKLSVEQSARALRYECFQNALNSGECDKIATAHHRDDNVETVLFNIFRGTGLKGLSGITEQRADKIIRPFLSLDRKDIEKYAKENGVPFVTDETNLSDDYTRNAIRHNVIPQIKKIFPELNQSVERLSQIVSKDDEYITSVAQSKTLKVKDSVQIALPCHDAVLSRAVIIALKEMGVKKDWEKVHVDQVIGLSKLENGAMLSLPKGITAIKEYDKIVFFVKPEKRIDEQPFGVGEFIIAGKKIQIKIVENGQIDLKSGLFLDLDKVSKTAVIRTRREGDSFTKFGGGSKALGDYFTDKKIPLRERDSKIVIANASEVLAIFGLSISERVRIDEKTRRIVEIKEII